MEFDVTEKKGFKKKTCYVCEKLGHLKRNCPKRAVEVSEKWIEMTEKPETVTGINHENLSWTACRDDQCWIHRSFKENVKWYPKKKNTGEEAKYFKQTLPNGNAGHNGNDD